jgi:hypothetical protein
LIPCLDALLQILGTAAPSGYLSFSPNGHSSGKNSLTAISRVASLQ